MKNRLLSAIALFSALFLGSCSDDSSETFNDANGNVTKKYVKTVAVTSTQYPEDNSVFTVNYDAAGRVTSTSDGTDTSQFVYENNNLTTVTGSSDPLSISELYESPFDAYEVGEVTNYDTNGNPVRLRLFERNDSGMILEEYVGEITYDNTPNPFFYTLEAAGILEVLDNVELNFSLTPQAQELVMAKQLLPVNNPKKFVVKKQNGQVVGQVVGDYVYDAAGYPTTATFTSTSDGEVKVWAASFTYRP